MGEGRDRRISFIDRSIYTAPFPFRLLFVSPPYFSSNGNPRWGRLFRAPMTFVSFRFHRYRGWNIIIIIRLIYSRRRCTVWYEVFWKSNRRFFLYFILKYWIRKYYKVRENTVKQISYLRMFLSLAKLFELREENINYLFFLSIILLERSSIISFNQGLIRLLTVKTCNEAFHSCVNSPLIYSKKLKTIKYIYRYVEKL